MVDLNRVGTQDTPRVNMDPVYEDRRTAFFALR